MKVTPLDLRQQRFSTAMRGFDRDEVTGFLAEVVKRRSPDDDCAVLHRGQQDRNRQLVRPAANARPSLRACSAAKTARPTAGLSWRPACTTSGPTTRAWNDYAGFWPQPIQWIGVALGARPVAALEPYLGSFGHLVALRSGDLAYLHVHPQGDSPGGSTTRSPKVSFLAAAPSAGLYRLHLDFQHEGIVHSAHFTVRAVSAMERSAVFMVPMMRTFAGMPNCRPPASVIR